MSLYQPGKIDVGIGADYTGIWSCLFVFVMVEEFDSRGELIIYSVGFCQFPQCIFVFFFFAFFQFKIVVQARQRGG